MKKLLLTILGPFVLVAAVALGIYTWDNGALPFMRPAAVDVSVEDINYDDYRGVRVKGTAHYELRIQQKEGDQLYTMYPLFPPGDTIGRDVRVIVRTKKVPDRLLGFEDVTVEGLARPPGRLVPSAVTDALLERGYSIQDDFVLINEFDEEDEEAGED